MKPPSYDLIGDIHGQYDKLAALLKHLGYAPHHTNKTWRHPAGRKVIFLGDYIDRGPAVREVLLTVRAMVEAGDAHAIMGNHEYNAIGYATPHWNGNGHLRPHTPQHVRQHEITLAQFAGRMDEWSEWLAWMKRLPMFLDLGALRAVHACWDAVGLEHLAGRNLADDEFLRACHTPDAPEYRASGHLLKGPELPLPAGELFTDKEGHTHQKLRVRWWNIPSTARLGDLAMPAPSHHEHEATPEALRTIPNYATDAPPVFIGHYWLPPHREKAPLAPNIACLDYSGAMRTNPLTAYRWDGERELRAEKFATATS